jgi:hypothetical protein
MKNLSPLLLAFTLLAACDQVKDPIPPSTPGPGPGEGVRRRVLLEDFTGHRCSNCPAAASTALQLQNLYGEDVIVVGIHATETFAAPLPPNPNNSYSTDFRTPAGDAYAQEFAVTWLPAGMVNRTPYNSSLLLAHSAWPTAVSQMIGLPASMELWISELTHNATNNTVSVEVKMAVLQPVSGAHNLTLYLTEDHVVDWQYNAQATPPDVPNYEHRHVLRTNLNGTWGEPVVTTSAAVGDTISRSYTSIPVSPSWNASNCAVVAYVYDADSDAVMQVVEKKLYP